MTVFTCAVLLLLLTLTCALPKPWSDPGVVTECETNDETETLCQRCAKATKSNIVYPMCCKDEEEAKNWCLHYTKFGIQGE